jgi:integrase/recombinase XerD
LAKPTSRLSRVLMVGPMAPFADAYAAELVERGYTPHSRVNLLRQMGRLSRWLDERALAAVDLSGGLLDEFVTAERVRCEGIRPQWSRPGLGCLIEVLVGKGVLADPPPPPPASAIEVLLASFERHLCTERALASGTIHGYLSHARRFLGGLPDGCQLSGLTAKDVIESVRRESAALSVSGAQNFISGLRSFLRFCFVEGLVVADLSEAALLMTGRRRSPLPQGITKSDAAALLAGCDRRRKLGRRDYAILVIALRLGLRAGEVARLRLDDIEWRSGEVVVRGKGGRHDRLPLPGEVGAAIAAYLKRGRPASEHREVFLRDRAPFRPIAAATVRSTVRRACRRAGVAEVGSHRLRHTLACEMVAAEVPLVQISQVLRHHSLQTTAIYARVDVEQLRTLARPWPGGGRP